MIIDVYLIVFNCVFSRAVTLNRCFIYDIMSSHHRTYYLFFEKKAPGRPGGFTEDAAFAKQTILKNVKKQIKEFKDDELDVDDRVRVLMDQISNNIRSLVKDGKTKQVVIVWSPFIFQNSKEDSSA